MSSGLVEKFLAFAEMEKKHAEALRTLANKLKHPVLAMIFNGISRDSEKHADIYRSLATLLSEVQPYISVEELREISSVIDLHIHTEAEMLQAVSEILSLVTDPRIKLLLSEIAVEENSHHKLLLNVKEKLVLAEVLAEDLVWDMIWKDSPWHGAPGG